MGIEKPDIQDQSILYTLSEQYDLPVVELEFLPVGADRNSSSYRAVAADSTQYFIKLRHGAFDETSVRLLKFLAGRGVASIIPPIETTEGRLWSTLGPFKLIVYPFIEGLNGYEVELSKRQWHDLGKALKTIHTTELPQTLKDEIRKETYFFPWGEKLRTFLDRDHDTTLHDPISAKLDQFLQSKRQETLDLILRAENLAEVVRDRSVPFVLCHSDIHAGNVLIEPDGDLHIVDWDDPMIAPKERDLMFIGCGYWGDGRSPQEEASLFYRGYGQSLIDPFVIAYYRYARIVEDIAIFSARIFEAKKSHAERRQSLRYLTSNFLPGSTIERAYALDQSSYQRG